VRASRPSPKASATQFWASRQGPSARTLFIIGGRGKVIYGDVGSVSILEFVLAQKIGLIDEAAASA